MQKLFLTKRQKNGNLTLFKADLKVSLFRRGKTKRKQTNYGLHNINLKIK